MATPVKDPKTPRSKLPDSSRYLENSNPNVSVSSPLSKPAKSSPAIASAKLKKPASKISTRVRDLPIQDRKFVVAKKNSKKEAPPLVNCKCKDKNPNLMKCPCVLYENLRASQEEFFKNSNSDSKNEEKTLREGGEKDSKVEVESGDGSQSEVLDGNGCSENGSEVPEFEEFELTERTGSSRVRKIRHRLLEEARNSIPETGTGRVMHLVKAFERILSIPKSGESKNEGDEKEEEKEKGMKWALPGLQPKTSEEDSTPPFQPPDFAFLSKTFNMGSTVFSSIDSNVGSSIRTSSNGSRTSSGTIRSRRNSSESSGRVGGRKWKKHLKATSQEPFKLRTEQRGRSKTEEFHKKVEEMLMEEKKQRIPIAQGLPWTTEEPECLVKPPVKESTKPLDFHLHSDVRAAERAEFDCQVAEKLSFIEQYKLERERQQKMEEEEEVRRLRRELVPKAQPMPYFDRPFIPKRSFKLPTIPKEPKFHVPQHKKIKCMSWSESLYLHQD